MNIPSCDGLQLNLDPLNHAYFQTLLFRKFNHHQGQDSDKLRIYDDLDMKEGWVTTYPTAICSPTLLKELPHIHYSDLQKEEISSELTAIAKKTALWIRPMQAGTGSSIERMSYLKKKRQKDSITLGAKGTDLFIELLWNGKKEEISLAELQILRAYQDASKGTFAKIIFQDLVSSETAISIKEIWNKPSLINKNKTYLELFSENSHVSTFSSMFQSYLPTINEEGQITTNRKAPGGHAIFGVAALRAAYLDHECPCPQSDSDANSNSIPLIGVTSNGEDLSGLPDSLMVGYMVKNRIPIVMVTTEKTEIDTKGGQIALIPRKSGKAHVTIIEKAQAQEAGQLPLFEQIGLREKDSVAFFNTNMALFNYQVLTPLLKNLVAEIGEEKFLNIIAPTLIENWKEQTDSDGKKRRYLQLEGAMGSVLLNLDRFWRDHYGAPLVHIINVSRKDRTRFFSPIKTAFDFFMQFHSDRFKLNNETLRLEDMRPGEIPCVELHQQYNDLETLMTHFKGCSLLDLSSLKLSKLVDLSHQTLAGDINL